MKKMKALVLLVLMLGLLTACGKTTDEETAEPTKSSEAVTETAAATEAAETAETVTATEPKDTPTPTPELTAEEKWYNSILEDSLVSTGNNYRLKNVIEKARNGEDVYIAAIGGSITEGEGANPNTNCYAYLTYQAFADMFGTGDNVHFINAGISGTPSTLGVIRYERDCIQKNDGHEPDLVIVEFAVNDGDDPTNGETYEGLVRHILMQDNDPAVVLLFSVFKSQWNLQDRCSYVGAFYGLPMVSIKDAIVSRLDDGSLTYEEYFNDEYHPTNYGHQLMADCMKYLFEQVDQEEKTSSDIEVTDKSWFGSTYENVVMIDNTDTDLVISSGSFDKIDNSLGTIRYDNTKTFPLNWMHTSSSGNDPFTLKVSCKALLMTYKSSSSCGKAEIYVDGELTQTVDGSAGGAWNNPYTVLVFENETSEEHTVEIKMAEGEESKSFTICAFGYAD